MNNSLKLLLKILGISLLVIAVIFFVVRYNTKAYSPEDTVSYTNNDLTLEVFYNRPYKKGREIFGNLVAYDSVWRTLFGVPALTKLRLLKPTRTLW